MKSKKKKYVWLCATPFIAGNITIFSTEAKAKNYCKKHNPTNWDLGMCYGKVEIK